jgi:deoxyribonuclease IV
MIKAGCHLSISDGFEKAGKTALEIGANTFQFFTRNPQGGAAKEIDPDDAAGLRDIVEKNGFAPLLAHAPYTINMCSSEERIKSFARSAFSDDLKRLKKLPCKLYNLHPGSHVGQGIQRGIELITEILNEYITQDLGIYVLLETMSGKGSEVGSRFEEIRQIYDGVKYKKWIGVCVDSCHLYSAGYDIVNDLDGVFAVFDRIIGAEKIKAIHLNDSKTTFGSKKDRHEKLGEGSIGLDHLVRFLKHDAVKDLPVLLETPNDVEGYRHEIDILKNME